MRGVPDWSSRSSRRPEHRRTATRRGQLAVLHRPIEVPYVSVDVGGDREREPDPGEIRKVEAFDHDDVGGEHLLDIGEGLVRTCADYPRAYQCRIDTVDTVRGTPSTLRTSQAQSSRSMPWSRVRSTGTGLSQVAHTPGVAWGRPDRLGGRWRRTGASTAPRSTSRTVTASPRRGAGGDRDRRRRGGRCSLLPSEGVSTDRRGRTGLRWR